jgi:octaprenyl-diphosphate synthase
MSALDPVAVPAVDASGPNLEAIQAPVEDDLARVVAELRRIVVSDFGMIEEVNDYLLMVRGKLFRPTLTLLANRVGDHRDPRAVTLAGVVELVHLATLVHDDAVDHSVLRRGQPTVNALWTHQVAIIMGDYLYSRAITELAGVGSLEAIQVMASAANEMSVGEMRQLTSYDALDFTEDDYYRLIAAKTASLMAAACEVGALVGEARFREPLARYGHALGMAFQIADDLLDYTGSEEVTGKPSGHDLRERKVTLPLVGAMSRASAAEMNEIRRLFTTLEPGDGDIARVVGLVTDLGGLEYAQRRASGYAERAEEALDGLDGGTALDALRSAVAYATRRSR